MTIHRLYRSVNTLPFGCARLLLERLERRHQHGQLDQDFDRQRSFGGRLTQAGPGSWQPDRSQWSALTHIQVTFGTFALEQDGQPLAFQRVKWVGDN